MATFKNYENYQTHIPHLTNLNPIQLLTVVEQLDKGNCYITEKIDGFSFGFGVDENGFYFQYKGNEKIRNSENIANHLYIHDTYFYNLRQRTSYFLTKINNHFHISAEAVPYQNESLYNVIHYGFTENVKKLDNLGIFAPFSKINAMVIYQIKIGNEIIDHNNKKYSYVIDALKASNFSFILNPIVPIEDYNSNIASFYRNDLLTLSKKWNKNHPATTQTKKINKEQILLETNLLASDIRKQFLSKQYRPIMMPEKGMNNEYEGFVIHSKDKNNPFKTKIITDLFTERKKLYWADRDHMKNKETFFMKNFEKHIKNKDLTVDFFIDFCNQRLTEVHHCRNNMTPVDVIRNQINNLKHTTLFPYINDDCYTIHRLSSGYADVVEKRIKSALFYMTKGIFSPTAIFHLYKQRFFDYEQA